MNIINSIALGLVQGITEFLPISSSGHLIIFREFMDMPLQGSLAFDVFLNTATLLAVLYCFWGDIKRIFIDLFTEGPSSRSKTLIFSIILGTIPAAFVGYKYGDAIESIFRSAHYVAWALILGSVLMFIADLASKKSSERTSHGINPMRGFVIGIFQALALFPGVSRSGASISGGLLSKLSREEAIRFSFLLYIPISIGALLKIILDLNQTEFSSFPVIPSLLAFIVALASGIWAVKFMVRYLSKHSFNAFIIYRIILALFLLIFLQ